MIPTRPIRGSIIYKLRLLALTVDRVPNVGGGQRALAHHIGCTRATLSKALSGKPINTNLATTIEDYVESHYTDRPRKFDTAGWIYHLTAQGFTDDSIERIMSVIRKEKQLIRAPRRTSGNQDYAQLYHQANNHHKTA